jgi:26S proteasome regulatory subunit N5
MDKIEKAEFILEQLRLCLDKKDLIKSQILSNKLSKKALADKELMVSFIQPFNARM